MINLNNSPLANDFLEADRLNEPEVYYPLRVYVCDNCFLVQADQYKGSGDIFNNQYAYFSSFSKSWVEHARKYTNMMIEKFGYNENSYVIEIASNDGYLLQHFYDKGIPVLGIEPSQNVAAAASLKGIPTMVEYFGSELANRLADEMKKGNLIIGNNVLAHVSDIDDFVEGLKVLLHNNGVITIEFPHLAKLIEKCEFDTIYHEHFSYLSLYAVNNIFQSHALKIFDVDQIPTHGGSLRIYACHKKDESKAISKNVKDLVAYESSLGINTLDYYQQLQNRAETIKDSFLGFLLEQKFANKKVIGYGAAAKGNTLLNFAGIKGADLISFVVDASDFKQNKYLPGSHISVVNEEHIRKFKPDYVIILPWNLKDEICEQLSYIREWGGQFVIFIPQKEIF